MGNSEKRLMITNAALKLMADGGMSNLTMKNLAARVGVTEPALYRHFKGKADIVREIIARFDLAVPAGGGKLKGFDALAEFARGRFRQVEADPPLARVMFAEEIFLGDGEFCKLVFEMMHRHKAALEKHFREAKKLGEVRCDIPDDVVFRLFFGPVRMLVKQWGMTNGAFDLSAKGEEILSVLRGILGGGENFGNEQSKQSKHKK